MTSLSVYLEQGKDNRNPAPDTQSKAKIQPVEKEPKERITSNVRVLQDGTGSEWSDVASGTSLATTATIASIAKVGFQTVLNLL